MLQQMASPPEVEQVEKLLVLLVLHSQSDLIGKGGKNAVPPVLPIIQARRRLVLLKDYLWYYDFAARASLTD